MREDDRKEREVTAPAQQYVYRWNREGRKDQVCEVLARGTMNSCCVRFSDGWTMITSKNALRKVKPEERRAE